MLMSTSSSWSWSLGVAVLLSVTACKGDDGSASSDTAGTSDTEASGITTVGDGDGDPTGDGDGDPAGDGDGDPTGDGDTADPGECGNGVVEGAESCDDGNTESGDGCSASCKHEGPIECGGQIYQCGDTLDNDDDGLIDLEDPECISPCDDDEATFKTALPGQNKDCKADCYFDSNSGGGDDKCEWNLKCDPENPGAEIGCEYDPNFMMCNVMMPQTCLDFCVPLVPNGCDCFGCCEIDGQFVYLDGAECALDNLGACESCTFFDNCNNPCEPEICELCFGQDPSELPEECDEPSCPDGVDSCLESADCPEAWYCQTGCCYPTNIP
ncbi:DUF4215 domain-containing protein [Enhygromyxa salina]|uniref:Multiple EGF-like-domain protein 3 n=1 Tax=Enhygromyxa salina TaxID=215803 RepID=A0A2S9YKR8_9BACT|nr:DUF4215 domain-containing protein [Enhygromyxa salina]PRQ05725.1 hypothetical protein ENSA7_43960 [Enhygromyxa salina]